MIVWPPLPEGTSMNAKCRREVRLFGQSRAVVRKTLKRWEKERLARASRGTWLTSGDER